MICVSKVYMKVLPYGFVWLVALIRLWTVLIYVEVHSALPEELAKVKITLGILDASLKSLCTQTTTEAFMNVVKVDVIPEVARVYVTWCNSRIKDLGGDVQIDMNHIPMNLITLPARYAQMMRQLSGKLRMQYEEVYLCPRVGCGAYRSTKDHSARCHKPGCLANTYLYGLANRRVSTLRYFRLPTLLRTLFANPFMARWLTHTYEGHVPTPEAMRGVHGK